MQSNIPVNLIEVDCFRPAVAEAGKRREKMTQK